MVATDTRPGERGAFSMLLQEPEVWGRPRQGRTWEITTMCEHSLRGVSRSTTDYMITSYSAPWFFGLLLHFQKGNLK